MDYLAGNVQLVIAIFEKNQAIKLTKISNETADHLKNLIIYF